MAGNPRHHSFPRHPADVANTFTTLAAIFITHQHQHNSTIVHQVCCKITETHPINKPSQPVPISASNSPQLADQNLVVFPESYEEEEDGEIIVSMERSWEWIHGVDGLCLWRCRGEACEDWDTMQVGVSPSELAEDGYLGENWRFW